MDAMLDGAENEAYLNNLNDLKPTRSFDFGERAQVMVSDDLNKSKQFAFSLMAFWGS